MKTLDILAVVILSLAVTLSDTVSAQSPDGEASTASVVPPTVPPQSHARDRALAKQVLQALSKTAGLNASFVTVKVKNGVVTLRGTVTSVEQIEKAQDAASSVPGVRAVITTLTVEKAVL